MSAGVLLVSLVCYCVYRGTAYAPMYCTTPMQHRASLMQVLRVMIHTTDPGVAEIHHLMDVGSSTLDIWYQG